MDQFISGVIFMLFLAIGLFFFRYGQRSRERLFFFFSSAFFLMAIEKVLRSFLVLADDRQWYFYLIRLLAFALILKAVVDENRSESSPRKP